MPVGEARSERQDQVVSAVFSRAKGKLREPRWFSRKQCAPGRVAPAYPWDLRRVATATYLVVASFFYLPSLANDSEVTKPQFQTREEYLRHREAALDHFRRVCREKAREIVNRVVENVDGILIKTPRQRPSEYSLRDQYWKGDAYGLVLYPPAEISRYLNDLDDNSIPTIKRTSQYGYKFVETPNSSGSGFVVNRLRSDRDGVVTEVTQVRRSRYAVVREDVSTAQDRSFWVAGGRLAVVDLSTGSVLGERVGYVFEAGFGSTSGGRRPWLIAQRNACPPIPRNAAIDRLFVEKVLRPAAHEHDVK